MRSKLEGFSLKQLEESVGVWMTLEKLGLKFADLQEELTNVRANSKLQAEEIASDQENNRNQMVGRKCPNCRTPLGITESSRIDTETEWFCPECNFSEETDLSLTDLKMMAMAKYNKTKPDFDPEEIRAPLVERVRRRKICMKCPNLTADMHCKKCGCGVKHRTYYDILTCPIKKW